MKLIAAGIVIWLHLLSCGNEKVNRRSAYDPRAAEANAAKDPTAASFSRASLAIREEITRLNAISKKYSNVEGSSLSLSGQSTQQALIQETTDALKKAASNLDAKSADTALYMSRMVRPDADGKLIIPSLEESIKASERVQAQILADKDNMKLAGATGSSVTKTLEESMKSTVVEKTRADIDSLMASAVKPREEFAKFLNVTHLRNFNSEELTLLKANVIGLRDTVAQQLLTYRQLVRTAEGFAQVYQLDAPTAAIAALKSALSSYDLAKSKVRASQEEIAKTAKTAKEQIATFESHIEGVKKAVEQLELIFRSIGGSVVGDLLSEIEKLGQARDIVNGLLETEERSEIKQALSEVIKIVEQSIASLSKVTQDLQAEVASANKTMDQQRKTLSNQQSILALQEEYLVSLKQNQERLAAAIKSDADYTALQKIVAELEGWAARAKAIAQKNKDDMAASVAPLKAALGDKLLMLSVDTIGLTRSILAAEGIQSKNLQLMRTSTAASSAVGILRVSAEGKRILFQITTLSGRQAQWNEIAEVHQAQGVIKDLIVRSRRNSHTAAIRYTEIDGATTRLVLLVGRLDSSTPSWKRVVLSSNYHRQSEISVNNQGMIAVAWQNADDTSYMQLFNSNSDPVHAQVQLQTRFGQDAKCNDYVSISLAPEGQTGIVSCAESITREFDVSSKKVVTTGLKTIYFQRFLLDGRLVDEKAVGLELTSNQPYYQSAGPNNEYVTGNLYPAMVAISDQGQYFAAGNIYDSSHRLLQKTALQGSILPNFFEWERSKSRYRTFVESQLEFITTDGVVSGLAHIAFLGSPDYIGEGPLAYSSRKTMNVGWKMSNRSLFDLWGIATPSSIFTEEEFTVTRHLNHKDVTFTKITDNGFKGDGIFRSPQFYQLAAGPLNRAETFTLSEGQFGFSGSPPTHSVFNQNYEILKHCGYRIENWDMGSFLGSLLTKGKPLVSCDGRYRLEIRDNGELVHLGPENKLLWSSVTGIEGKEPAKPEQVGEHLRNASISLGFFALRLMAGAKEQIFLQHAEVGRATQPILVVSNFGHVGIINWDGFTPLYRSNLYPDY